MSRHPHWFVPVLLAATTAAAAPARPPAAEPTLASIASGYTRFRLLTPRPVPVDPQLALLCAPAAPGRARAATEVHGPHAGATIRVFMNALAAKAFAANADSYPVGSVVVKEKLADGGREPLRATGVGGMVKRAAGYDAAHGDWEYFYFEQPARIESGAIASCAGCHASARAKDHVFGNWRASAGDEAPAASR